MKMTPELEELLAAARAIFMAIPAKEANRLLTAVRAVEDSQARIDAPDPHDFDNAGLRMSGEETIDTSKWGRVAE